MQHSVLLSGITLFNCLFEQFFQCDLNTIKQISSPVAIHVFPDLAHARRVVLLQPAHVLEQARPVLLVELLEALEQRREVVQREVVKVAGVVGGGDGVTGVRGRRCRHNLLRFL